MKISKKILALIIIILVFGILAPQIPNYSTEVQAASVKLNRKKATIIKGKTLKLKVSGTKNKVTWKSSNKKIASVSSTGKVTAKKSGTATITAKIEKIQLKCKITVKDTESSSNQPDNNMVWIDDTGKKYHNKPTCSNMDAPYQVSREKAISMGKDACKKCYR